MMSNGTNEENSDGDDTDSVDEDWQKSDRYTLMSESLA